MITCIRDVRVAKGLTLAEVAARCRPPTTAQTIGRLETGMRTVSMGWLDRIAHALKVTPETLLQLPERASLPVLGALSEDGLRALSKPAALVAPVAAPGTIAIQVRGGAGEYRSGDVIWCEQVAADRFAAGLNRDVAAPRGVGRFVFGRLIGQEDGRLLILPPGHASRQQVVTAPAWIAVVRLLVRTL